MNNTAEIFKSFLKSFVLRDLPLFAIFPKQDIITVQDTTTLPEALQVGYYPIGPNYVNQDPASE